MHEQIKSQIKDAMRAKDALRLEVLRGLTSAFTNELLAQKSAATALPDESVIAIIRKAVKQRKDSIDQFEKGGRPELAEKEKAELAILEGYLPKLMSRDDIRMVVRKKMADLASTSGAPDKAKAGQFMGSIMKDLKGKADGADVKAVIDEMFV
jgi:uncharacterized protein YqeY